MNNAMAKRFNDYVNETFVREDDLLQFVRQQTAEHGLPQINLQPYEGRLLQLLIQLNAAERVIEIGTLAGYSGIWIARGLPTQGKLVTIEKSSVHAALARSHFERAGLSHKVTVLQGDGIQILKKLAAQAPWDLIFIDADKVNYPNYLDWAALHLRVGGALLAHNAFRGGYIFNPETEDDHGMVKFNQALATHPQFESTIIEVGDGLAIGIKTG